MPRKECHDGPNGVGDPWKAQKIAAFRVSRGNCECVQVHQIIRYLRCADPNWGPPKIHELSAKTNFFFRVLGHTDIYTHILSYQLHQPFLSNWGEHLFFSIHGMVFILDSLLSIGGAVSRWDDVYIYIRSQISKHAVEFPAVAM